MVIQM